MNRNGKSNKTFVAIVLFGIVLCAILAMAILGNPFKQQALDKGTTTPGSSTTSCQGSNPAFAPIASDAITGASVTVSGTYLYTPASSSTAAKMVTLPSTIDVGAKVKGFVNASGYIPEYVGSDYLKCGGNNPTVQLYGYANASVTVKDDPNRVLKKPCSRKLPIGIIKVFACFCHPKRVFQHPANGIPNAITQGGGVYNATPTTTAIATRTYSLLLTGTPQKSTGKIVIVVESPASMNTNISTLVVNCPNSVPYQMPTAIGNTNANSIRTAVEIPALIGGSANTECKIQVTSNSGKIVKGGWLVTYYAVQPYIASDNTIQTDSIVDTTPNGGNTNKYIDSYTSSFYAQ